MRSTQLVLCAALLALGACGDDGSTADTDAAADIGRDTSRPGRDTDVPDTDAPDVEADTPSDTADDVPAPDASDASTDAAEDAGGDTVDVGDAGPDTPCVPGCVLEGVAACDAATGGVIRCTDIDGCLQFSAPVACSPGTECLGGACVPSTCEDVCEAGTTRCAPGAAGVQGCLDTDGDGCTEWGEPTACPDDVACAAGVCPGACVDTCVDGSFACDGTGVSQCYDTDGDGCVEQGAPIPCPTGSTCEAGECVELAGECLILSEVIEGDSNNKAVEIYNCGGPISLDDIWYCSAQNGVANCNRYLSLSGTLAPGEMRVLCHSSITSSVRSLCDEQDTAVQFNGNDRIVVFRDVDGDEELDRAVDEVFDAFGETSRQPSSEIWSDTTYRRCTADTYDGTGSFDVTRYYSEHGTDDFSQLGDPPDLSGCR